MVDIVEALTESLGARRPYASYAAVCEDLFFVAAASLRKKNVTERVSLATLVLAVDAVKAISGDCALPVDWESTKNGELAIYWNTCPFNSKTRMRAVASAQQDGKGLITWEAKVNGKKWDGYFVFTGRWPDYVLSIIAAMESES